MSKEELMVSKNIQVVMTIGDDTIYLSFIDIQPISFQVSTSINGFYGVGKIVGRYYIS